MKCYSFECISNALLIHRYHYNFLNTNLTNKKLIGTTMANTGNGANDFRDTHPQE